jgi:hypothetical protein
MGWHTCAKVGTCRFLVYNGCLHEDDYCPSCRKTRELSVGYLSKNSKLWKGVCFHKYPPTNGSYIPRNQLLESHESGCPKRTHKKKNHFVAKPSKGKMGFESPEKSFKHPILQKICNNLDNTAIDWAIAARYVCIDNQDQENNDPSQKK